MCAKPGTSDFGAITLAINFYTNIDYIVTVPAKDFLPAPNVDSAVTRMEIVKNKIEVEDKNLLFSIIKASFLMKRKTLLNSLGSAKILGIDKASLGNILEKLNIPQNVRAENLSIEDFNRLTSEYIKISKDKGIK